MRVASLVVVVVFIAVVGATRARADCLGPPSFASGPAALDGVTDAPLNVAVVGPSAGSRGFSVVAVPHAGGLPVNFAGDDDKALAIFTPLEDLVADTDYDLFCDIEPVEADRGDDADHVCARFHTGTVRDDDAPLPASVASQDASGAFNPLGIGECPSPANATIVTVALAAPDDADVVTAELIRVHDDADSTEAGVASSLTRLPLPAGATVPLLVVEGGGGDATYEAVFVDGAGNRSSRTEVTQSLGCPGSCSQGDTTLAGASALALAALALRRRRR